jgi:fumarate reductase flavoprotein subunit
VNINGANRLGSNSLTELLVFGARAGRAAAEFAANGAGPANGAVLAQAHDEERRLQAAVERQRGQERVSGLRDEMHAAMDEGAGIYRNAEGLGSAISTIRELQQRYGDVALDDQSRTFNTDLVASLELANLLDVAEAVLQSALSRTESRGAHQRTDHPDRDDDRLLSHSLAFRTEDGEPRIEYDPVTITRWPPGKRVYGEQIS